MIEVIGVKFKSGGKMYYFAPGSYNPAEGSYVVVETARGAECGEVAARRHAVSDDSVTAPLKPILRLANEEDLKELEKKRQFMDEAFRICQERIEARGLPMRLVDIECGFDSNKLIFYFTAESRVDFRELVKDLANAFHVRIELRQIGDRDEAKLLGGLGICGREFCCKGYLNNFQPISIKMAKEQGLALNPSKISGACGRLMCCLRYESPVYEELIKLTPKTGSTVLLPGDPPVRAYVMEANLVTGNLRVKPENSDTPITVSRDSVERLTDMSRRMTRDDLRDKRSPAPGGKAAPQKNQQQPQQQEQSAQEKQEKPQKPQQNRQKRMQHGNQNERQQRPANANHAAQQPERQAEQRQTEQRQQPEPRQAEQTPALYAEFGENRRPASAPAPQPHRPAAPLPADMDFTEHRAVVEHPERVQESGHPEHKPHDGNRRFRPRGNGNYRNSNNRGNNGSREHTDFRKKPQGGENGQGGQQ